MREQLGRNSTQTSEEQVNQEHDGARNAGRTAVVAAEADAILDDIDAILEEFETDEDKDKDLLDEMDAVLEKNAEQFVDEFIQKGGQ